MLRRPWFLALLFIALAFPSPAQQVDASAAGTLVPLNAPWRLHFGDDPAYAQPGFDDSHWALHDITKDWASERRNGYGGHGGYAWYRMRVSLPKGNEPMALAIFPTGAAEEVYIDGALAGTIGRMRPEPIWTAPRDVYAVAVPAALHGRSVQVALRVWLTPLVAAYLNVGANRPPLLGAAGDVERMVSLAQQDRWVARMPDWAVDLLGFAVGLFSLGIFLIQRQAREYAYAAVFFCCLAANNLYTWASQQSLANVEIFQQVYIFTGSILLCMWLLFTWRFVRARPDRLLYACLAAAWVQFITTALTNLEVMSVAGSWVAYAAGDLFLAVAVFIRLYALARRGNRDAQLFLIPFSLWSLANGVYAIVWAFGSSGIANLFSAWTLYHGSRFDITWGNVLGLLFNLSVGAVLVLRYARSAKQEQLLRGELEAARTVQQILVPEETPSIPGFSVQAVYQPAGQVGGDFYQVLPAPNGGLLAVIGDVSGKGMPAAMTVSLLVGTVRTLAHYTHDPAAILTAMNQRMIGRGSGFTTALVLRLDRDGTLTAANAGHIAPYANGKELEIDNGLPLGITAASAYCNSTLHLEADTTLTLLTDGVVEAQNAKGELFGFERSRELSNSPAAAIVEAARAFGQEDDITVLTLARHTA
jgi:hypothetical protein